MQSSHDGGSHNAAAGMQFNDMLALDDTSMADFDLPSDFDLVNFNESITTGNNDPTHQNPFHPPSQAQDLGLHASNKLPDDIINQQDTSNNTPDNDDDDDAQMTGVGAGPLPTGFGVSLPPNTGSTLTEFTKRRNWSQRVVEELKDFLHILTPDGRIMFVSPSAQTLTGYEPQELVGKIMANFVHQDDSGMFMREFHESIASGHPLRFFYRLRKSDQTYVIFEAHGHPHFSSDVTAGFGGGSSSHGVSFCRGFFMMSRPYPSKNAALLDSFLEHKIENERLQKRIADLKREEQDDLQDQHMAASAPSSATGPDHRSGASGAMPMKTRRPSLSADSGGRAGSGPSSDYSAMPPPAKPPISNWALTQSNLDEALAASRPDSINDKMARYEGSNHLEGIEMMTGLRYRDGERSKGISTGAMSPNLLRGDQGIEYPADREGHRNSADRTRNYADSPSRGAFGAGDSERKKKIKVADEYVCTDCGTLDSPEWRRGPNGPKTLCNACGLRWAKQEKKRVGSGQGNGKSNNGSGSADSNRHSMAGNATSSPTTASQTPKASMAGTSPNSQGLPAMGNMQNNNSNMPIFRGNPAGGGGGGGGGGQGGPISVNIPAAQAMQNMQGMTGSPMSGMSPMSTMPGTNVLGGGGPGMPSVLGGGQGIQGVPFSPTRTNMPQNLFPQSSQPQQQPLSGMRREGS